MYAIEFNAKIKEGMIQIPEKYKDRLQDNVRVIVLAEYEIDTPHDLIGQLLESPLKITGFKPYKRDDIYQ